jgi:hypothetical protein
MIWFGRDWNCGTGLELRDGTGTAGRDSRPRTRRNPECPHPAPSHPKRTGGGERVGRDSNCGTGRDFVGGDKAGFVRLRRTGTPCFVPRQRVVGRRPLWRTCPTLRNWDGTRTVGRDTRTRNGANSRIALTPALSHPERTGEGERVGRDTTGSGPLTADCDRRNAGGKAGSPGEARWEQPGWDNFQKRQPVPRKPLAESNLRTDQIGMGLVRLRGLGLRRVALPAIYVI